MPSFCAWAELSDGLLGCGQIPVVPISSAHFWRKGTCMGKCGCCSPRRLFWSWTCTDPRSQVSLLLHHGQQATSLLLLGLSATLQHWSQRFCPLMLHHDLRGWGRGRVSVKATRCLTLIPALIFDASEWTYNVTCVLLLCSETPGLVHTYQCDQWSLEVFIIRTCSWK